MKNVFGDSDETIHINEPPQYVVLLDDIASQLLNSTYVWWDTWADKHVYSQKWREASEGSRYQTQFTMQQFNDLMPIYIKEATSLYEAKQYKSFNISSEEGNIEWTK